MVFALSLFAAVSLGQSQGSVDVTTRHNDTSRTGWNKFEKVLNPETVASPTFHTASYGIRVRSA